MVSTRSIQFIDDPEYDELAKLLEDRVYEFNQDATGLCDGAWISGKITNDDGEVIAGFNGHTRGGCCQIDNLWVHESLRGQGIGSQLINAAEAEAIKRGCDLLTLSTHNFQAPDFYRARGYVQAGVVEGRPRGHRQFTFAKRLGGGG